MAIANIIKNYIIYVVFEEFWLIFLNTQQHANKYLIKAKIFRKKSIVKYATSGA
jgi:hypothetical protein